MPNDNFLYQVNIFYIKWWFLEIEVFGLLIIYENATFKQKVSKWSSKRKDEI